MRLKTEDKGTGNDCENLWKKLKFEFVLEIECLAKTWHFGFQKNSPSEKQNIVNIDRICQY